MAGLFSLGAEALKANPIAEPPRLPRRVTHGGAKLDPLRRELLRAQDKRCCYCPAPIDFATCTLEHVFPLNGGERRVRARPTNIILACEPCNTAKGGREPTPREIEILRVIQQKRQNP